MLDYLLANLNESDDKNYNRFNLIHNSMRNKKSSYDELQDYENGLLVQKDIVKFMESRLSPDSPNLLKDKIALSECYSQLKDYEATTAVDEELLPRVEKVFGAKSNEARKVKGYLAQDYHDSLRYSDAAKVYEEILKSDIEVYGETDYKTIDSYDSLIDEYLNLGKYEEMGTLLARAVPLAEENLKEDSNLKYGLLLKQAVYYSLFTRQMQKAEALYNKMLAMPVGNEEKAISLILIAENCFFADDYSNAINYILKAWDIYEKYLPEKKKYE